MTARAFDLKSAQAVPRPPRVCDVAGASLLRPLFRHWEPDRPELLIRLRPRTEECRVPR